MICVFQIRFYITSWVQACKDVGHAFCADNLYAGVFIYIVGLNSLVVLESAVRQSEDTSDGKVVLVR